MDIKSSRNDVYKSIDRERDYQEKVWGELERGEARNHPVEGWIIYIEHYVIEAKKTLTIQPSPAAEREAGHALRKVAALAVAAMENTGVINRETKD